MAQDMQIIGMVAVHPNGNEYRYDRAIPVPCSHMDIMLARSGVCEAFKRDFRVECIDVLVAS